MPAFVGTIVHLVLLLHVWPAAEAMQSGTSPIAYRFHHVHVGVPDPAGAMNAASSRLGGSRTLLRGHGVAVRTAAQYLVFDRENPEDARAASRANETASDVQAQYLEAVRWLNDRGGTALPPSFDGTAIAAGIRGERVHSIAFSTDDLSKATAALVVRGATPLEQTSETVRFRLPSGTAIEIVRQTDLPDAFWCPMHPDIRTAQPEKCPVCGMALVPIPPPRLGEYRLDASLTFRGKGSSLRLVVRTPTTNDVVRQFVEVHERLFHLFAVNRDLSTFAHLHPDPQKDGAFELRWDLPPGEYVLIGDFLPAAGTPQMVHRTIITPDYRGPLFAAVPELKAGESEQIVDGLRIRLDAPRLIAFRNSDLRFTFADARTGEPTQDLEPFLGASGHLLLVSPDLTTAIHGHPEGSRSSGPVVVFAPLIPVPGAYKLWVQVQRGGKVITASFVIDVKPVSP